MDSILQLEVMHTMACLASRLSRTLTGVAIVFALMVVNHQGSGLVDAISNENLPLQLRNHTFLFIVGTHHSGTSLLKLILQQHPSISGMMNTNVAEDEGTSPYPLFLSARQLTCAHVGQHLQTIYRNAKHFGGFVKYAFKEAAHMDETHELATTENRELLFNQWARFWDLSKPILMEKSPRHPVMMRFLQAMFTASRYQPSVKANCGRDLVKHWLIIMNKMANDVQYLEKAVVFQYEDFLATTVEAAKSRLDKAVRELLNIENPIELQGPPEIGRRLLAFHGGRDQIQIHTGFQFSWILQFFSIYDINSRECQSMIEELESDVNNFGYSLRNFTNFWRPPAFDKPLGYSAMKSK